MRRGDSVLAHTPGGGDIALRSTDHLRFLYAILKKGRWGNELTTHIIKVIFTELFLHHFMGISMLPSRETLETDS